MFPPPERRVGQHVAGAAQKCRLLAVAEAAQASGAEKEHGGGGPHPGWHRRRRPLQQRPQRLFRHACAIKLSFLPEKKLSCDCRRAASASYESKGAPLPPSSPTPAVAPLPALPRLVRGSGPAAMSWQTLWCSWQQGLQPSLQWRQAEWAQAGAQYYEEHMSITCKERLASYPIS